MFNNNWSFSSFFSNSTVLSILSFNTFKAEVEVSAQHYINVELFYCKEVLNSSFKNLL